MTQVAHTGIGIDGIHELRNSIAAWRTYRREAQAAADSWSKVGEESIPLPREPEMPKPDDVAKQYPRAAAFLRAERVSFSQHLQTAERGERAMMQIAEGEDFEQILSDLSDIYCGPTWR